MGKDVVAMEAALAARHSQGARKSLGRIAWSFFVRLKWQYLPLLLSDYTREILRRKYDAFATDRAYEDRPSGLLGPLGRWVDRRVLNFPTHEGLRQRLQIVVDNVKADVHHRLQDGVPRVRVLSAPCGLLRDLLLCATELREEDARTSEKLELHALDLDAMGEVLPAASLRAAVAGVPVRFYRDDLFNPESLGVVLREGTRFHVMNCIGLTTWLDLEDVGWLAGFFHDQVLVPGGTLIIDNWASHKYSSLGRDMEIYSRYHNPEAFAQVLGKSGFQVVEAKTTANGVATVYVARAGRSR